MLRSARDRRRGLPPPCPCRRQTPGAGGGSRAASLKLPPACGSGAFCAAHCGLPLTGSPERAPATCIWPRQPCQPGRGALDPHRLGAAILTGESLDPHLPGPRAPAFFGRAGGMTDLDLAGLSPGQLRLLDLALAAELSLRASGVAHEAEAEVDDGFLTIVISVEGEG